MFKRGRYTRWLVIGIGAPIVLLSVFFAVAILWSTIVEHTFMSRVKLGMPKTELRSTSGMRITPEIDKREGFPYENIIRQKVLIGNPAGYKSVDSYGYCIGEFWVYFDADEKVIAVCESYDD